MATKLTKKLIRELLIPDEYGNTIMMEMEPGDLVSFRLKGKKTRYSVSLHKVFMLAFIESMIDSYNEKKATYKQKKAAGYSRLRKPKKPPIHLFRREMQLILSTKSKN